jgi:hypothetical protein
MNLCGSRAMPKVHGVGLSVGSPDGSPGGRVLLA